MKVVGFKNLGKKKKTKEIKIFCLSNVFKNAMIVGSFLLAFFVIGIINQSFTMQIKECIQNFVSSMGNIIGF